MKALLITLFAAVLAQGARAAEPALTRAWLEQNYFQSIKPEGDRVVLRFKDEGERYYVVFDGTAGTVNAYGSVERIAPGQTLTLSSRHGSLTFTPLPPPLDKKGFLVESRFDARSFGGAPSSRYGIMLLAKDGPGAALTFLEPVAGFDPKLPPTDATYQEIVRAFADADPFERKELVAEAGGKVIKPPFPATVATLHFRWQKKAGGPAGPLEIRWIATEIGAAAAPDHLIAKNISGSQQDSGDFALKPPPAGFPPGKYRIEIWRAGGSIYAQSFDVTP